MAGLATLRAGNRANGPHPNTQPIEHRRVRPVAWSTLPAFSSPATTASFSRPSSVTLPHRLQVVVVVVMPAPRAVRGIMAV
jgi:hypothetical protein